MCGIIGIWNTDGAPVDLAELEAGTSRLRHRGPDDEGYLLVDTRTGRTVLCGAEDTNRDLALPPIHAFAHQAFDLAFGFRRLAILDLSPAGHQPMASQDGRFWLIFNGEVYNYLELRDELSAHGYSFRSGTDSEVILAAYQRWGPKCLLRFNGMWALALWDNGDRKLFIARDRFGVKPLYFVNKSGRLAFASEIKGLVGSGRVSFEPDGAAIYRYLLGGMLPSPRDGRTFFRGVESLPGGHWMMAQRDTLLKQRFWTLPCPDSSSPEVAPAEVVEEYRELFTDAVRLRLRADVPVGTCLSGGVDSSSIVCVINRLMAQGGLSLEQIGLHQKTFSAVYETEGRYNERAYVDTVVNTTRAQGNVTFPTVDWLANDLERLVWHQDEPFQSTSMFAQWCVMWLVRQCGVTVLLDGQGADELLGGYRPYLQYLGSLLRVDRIAQALTEGRAIARLAELSLPGLLAQAVRYQLSGAPVEAVRRRRAASRVDRGTLNQEFSARQAPETELDWWPRYEHRSLDGHLRNLVEESMLPHLLRYEDRNSMAFGVEARVPFLDYRLVELSFGRAARWRIHDGWTKWVLRKAMEGIVPDEIVWRRDKVGFETPEAAWMRRWLDCHPDFFSPGALSRDYLDLDAVHRKLASCTYSEADTRQIWRWINLEIWLRVWSRV